MNPLPAKTPEAEADTRFYYSIARNIALAAAVFSLTVMLMMLINHVRYVATDPLNSEVLLELIEAHNQDPGDLELQAQIRALDLLARKALFNSLDFGRWGSYLLLIGLLTWVGSLKAMATLSAKLPDPRQYREVDRLSRRAISRWLVSVTGALVVAAVFAMVLTFRTALPVEAAIEDDTPPPLPQAGIDFPAPEEVAANWPNFRGPTATGSGHTGSAPTSWDVSTGAGVKWKVKLPKPGFSSPVIWGDSLFITGGDKEARELYALDCATGELRWRCEVRNPTGAEPPELGEDTGLAPITAATDGTRVFAMYPTGDLAAVDFAGGIVWQRNVGLPKNELGHASSPVVWQDLLLVQVDQSDSEGQLLALKAATGKTVWQQTRKVDLCWSTPAIAELAGRPIVLINGHPLASAFDLRSGEHLWSTECMSGEVAPSPAVGGGLAFFATEYAKLAALDLATGALKWEVKEDLPDVSSPAATDSLIFIANNSGVVTCHEIASGKQLWKQEFDEGFYASPLIIGELVYLLDLYGGMHIFKAAPTYEPLPRQMLEEETFCTPAIANGCLYLRASEHLYCFGGSDD
jgi:outer membrane protein assembly factor BamB